MTKSHFCVDSLRGELQKVVCLHPCMFESEDAPGRKNAAQVIGGMRHVWEWGMAPWAS